MPLDHPIAESDWERERLLAEFEGLHERFDEWARRAPRWPPFGAARRLLERMDPRLRELERDLGRALVVGFFGGSGTGKSTLFNALLGRRVSLAGKERRPMTQRAVVAHHPDVDASFLRLDDDQREAHALDLPLLGQMILVDGPDPDTPDPDDPDGRRRLKILRATLHHCDILVHTVTSEKYKTKAVEDALKEHAPGRQILYVQTRAAIDPDNRDDLRAHLQAIGLSVPEVFRFDTEEALASQEHGTAVDGEFGRFRRLLEHGLGGQARQRIRRANILWLYVRLLEAMRAPIDEQLREDGDNPGGLAHLERAIAAARAEVLAKVRARLGEQVLANRGLWRARLLRQLTLSWGGGPLAGLLTLWSAGATLLRPRIPLLPRTPALAVMTAGMTLGQKWREGRQDVTPAAAGIDLGLTEGDLARVRTILRGHLAEAEIELDPPDGAGGPTGEPSGEELALVARRVDEEVEAAVASAIERRVARSAGGTVHLLCELAFALLPFYLFLLMGRNFFYEHLWQQAPLLGLDFFLHALFWCVLWGVLLGSLLLAWLDRGLDREIAGIVDRLSPEGILGPLYADLSAACAGIRRHAVALDHLRRDLDRLQHRLGQVEDLGLGSVRT